jgi:SNF2 family DNA or RNA helicase
MSLQLLTYPGAYCQDEIDNEPLNLLKEILGSVDRKIGVFCNFRSTIEMLAKEFADLSPALVYGGSSTQANVKKFLQDESCRVVFLNYESGGAGFNLQEVCNQLIFFEPNPSPGALDQAIGRVQRGGQTIPVVVWMFNYNRTSNSKLLKKAFSRNVGVKEVVGDEFSFLDDPVVATVFDSQFT